MKGFFKEQNIMSAIAHINDKGEVQLLADHLRGTASLASEFASAFGASQWGKAAGLLHDDGKFLPAFLERIRNVADGKPAKLVVHSTQGAVYAIKHINDPPGSGKLLAYCTAGHHTGLPDGKAGDDDTCLARRLDRSEIGPGFLANELPSALEPIPLPKPPTQAGRIAFSAAFFARMIYSCLVDADFLDTEYFFEPKKVRIGYQIKDLSK